MPSFTRTVAIRRSPDQVFAVLDDLEQAPQWMPAIRRIDVLTPGMRIGVGFKWRETRRVLGILRVSVVLVVTAYERPTTWGLTYNDGKVQAVATFDLAATPSGTQVTFTEDVEELQGKAGRAERTLKMMEKQDGDLLERLKAHVEATSEEPAGLAPDMPAAGPVVESASAPAKTSKSAKASKAKGSKGKKTQAPKAAKTAKPATKAKAKASKKR